MKVWQSLFVAGLIASCGSEKDKEIIYVYPDGYQKDKDSKEKEESSFQDSFLSLEKAPVSLQKASHGVVKIQHLNWTGTGFFAKWEGQEYLFTNNHVVGVDSCYQEGCYLSLISDFQEGFKSQEEKVFLEPHFMNKDLDVSLWKVSLVKEEQKTPYKPSYIFDFSFEKASSLAKEGKNVYLLGHPLGYVKRFSQGKIFTEGNGIAMHSSFSVGGTSGSPLLNEEGKVIGIHHSSSTDFTDVSSSQINVNAYISTGVKIREIYGKNLDDKEEMKKGAEILENLNAIEKEDYETWVKMLSGFYVDEKNEEKYQRDNSKNFYFIYTGKGPQIKNPEKVKEVLYQNCQEGITLAPSREFLFPCESFLTYLKSKEEGDSDLYVPLTEEEGMKWVELYDRISREYKYEENIKFNYRRFSYLLKEAIIFHLYENNEDKLKEMMHNYLPMEDYYMNSYSLFRDKYRNSSLEERKYILINYQKEKEYSYSLDLVISYVDSFLRNKNYDILSKEEIKKVIQNLKVDPKTTIKQRLELDTISYIYEL